MSIFDTGDGTKDVLYREYRDKEIRKLLGRASAGAVFQLRLTIVGTSRETLPLNLTRADVEGILEGLSPTDPERSDDSGSLDVDHLIRCGGYSGACCTGAESDPCTC